MSSTTAPFPPTRGNRWLRPLMAVTVAIDRVSFVAIVAAMGGMAALVATQVLFRYALSSSIDSADELSRLLFVWAMFLAIPHGIPRGIHVGVDILVNLLPKRPRAAVFRATSALGAVLMATVLYATVFVTADKWQELMPTIDVTAAVYYIAVLLSAGHSLLHLTVLALGGEQAWEGALAS